MNRNSLYSQINSFDMNTQNIAYKKMLISLLICCNITPYAGGYNVENYVIIERGEQ